MADYDFRKASRPDTLFLTEKAIGESIDASLALSDKLGFAEKAVSKVDLDKILSEHPKLYGSWGDVSKELRDLQRKTLEVTRALAVLQGQLVRP
jgi:hypothetical protein